MEPERTGFPREDEQGVETANKIAGLRNTISSEQGASRIGEVGMKRYVLLVACLAASGGCLPGPGTGPDESLSIDYGGLNRHYQLHIPSGHDPTVATPLVIMLHGATGTAVGAAMWYGWNEQSDVSGFLVAYPQGVDNTWNAEHCCGGAFQDGVDDVGFIVSMIADIESRAAVDRRRIFVTGMSNGAMMAYRLAAERPDVFAAVGAVAGSIGGQASASAPLQVIPTPPSPVAVMMFHGTDDQHVLYNGGETVSGLMRGRIDLSVDDAVRFWVQANGANPNADDSANATGHVLRRSHASSDGYGDVVRYAVVGQGHAWPGGSQPNIGPYYVGDRPSTEISATATLWAFFSSHPKP